jgi:hypothetical protein
MWMQLSQHPNITTGCDPQRHGDFSKVEQGNGEVVCIGQYFLVTAKVTRRIFQIGTTGLPLRVSIPHIPTRTCGQHIIHETFRGNWEVVKFELTINIPLILFVKLECSSGRGISSIGGLDLQGINSKHCQEHPDLVLYTDYGLSLAPISVVWLPSFRCETVR